MSNDTTTAIAPYDGSTDLARSTAGYNHAWRLAQTFAQSQLVPQHLRGKPHDCMIALFMAEQMGENPLTVMQSVYIVKGKAGWAAQYVIARANRSDAFEGRINWREEGEGDSLKVTAYAKLADTGEEVSFPVSMATAHAEGWTSNPKYRSLPQLMLRYRSAVFLVRLYAPDVMLGYHSAEEIETLDVAPVPPAGRLQDALDAEVVAPTVEDDIAVIREVAEEHTAADRETPPEEPPTQPVEPNVRPARADGAVALLGKRGAAKEIADMESQLTRQQLDDIKGATGVTKRPHSKSDAEEIDTYHAALLGRVESLKAAHTPREEPLPPEPSEEAAPPTGASTDARARNLDFIHKNEDRVPDSLRDSVGLDYGAEALDKASDEKVDAYASAIDDSLSGLF